MSTRIQALIFDFDGLILDTEVPEYQSWKEAYEEYGCHLDLQRYATCIGQARGTTSFDPYADLESQLGRAIDRDKVREKRRRRNLELVAAQPILPGVEAYLRGAKRHGLTLAVASSSPLDWVDGHLERLGLRGYFNHLSCADIVGRGKPDPGVYLEALSAISVTPCQAIAFEDSPNGALAAKRAGIFCVVVPNPIARQLPFDQVDCGLNCLTDMPLRSLLARFP